MENINTLINLLISYLEKQTQSLSSWDIFIKYWVPGLGILIPALCAWGTYSKSEERKISEKMLSEVYAPLYAYFVKQEMYLYLALTSQEYNYFKRDERPICEITETKTEIKQDKVIKTNEVVLNLNRKEFLNVLKGVNIGLTSKELYSLLNMYNALIYVEEKGFTQRDNPNNKNAYYKATIMKVDVENKLREEIIKGYKKYHKKLKLGYIIKNKFYETDKNYFKITHEVPNSEIEKLRQDMSENPDIYK